MIIIAKKIVSVGRLLTKRCLQAPTPPCPTLQLRSLLLAAENQRLSRLILSTIKTNKPHRQQLSTPDISSGSSRDKPHTTKILLIVNNHQLWVILSQMMTKQQETKIITPKTNKSSPSKRAWRRQRNMTQPIPSRTSRLLRIVPFDWARVSREMCLSQRANLKPEGCGDHLAAPHWLAPPPRLWKIFLPNRKRRCECRPPLPLPKILMARARLLRALQAFLADWSKWGSTNLANTKPRSPSHYILWTYQIDWRMYGRALPGLS